MRPELPVADNGGLGEAAKMSGSGGNPWVGLVGGYMNSRNARRRLAATTRATYRGVLTAFATHVATLPLSASPEDQAAAVDDWLDANGWAVSTCCTNLGIVRPFLDWCAGRGHIAPGASAILKNPRKNPPLPRAMNGSAVAALFDAVPDARGRVIVLLEVQAGLRRAEVAAIAMGDLDMLDGSLLVHGKGGKERRVYLSDETLAAIRVWLVERGHGPGALICPYGQPTRHLTPTWVGMLVTRWMREAGLKSAPRDGVSGHALRHTAATQLLRNGANIRVVQSAMGHESIVTTARYLRADDPEVREAMRELSYGARHLRVAGER